MVRTDRSRGHSGLGFGRNTIWRGEWYCHIGNFRKNCRYHNMITTLNFGLERKTRRKLLWVAKETLTTHHSSSPPSADHRPLAIMVVRTGRYIGANIDLK